MTRTVTAIVAHADDDQLGVELAAVVVGVAGGAVAPAQGGVVVGDGGVEADIGEPGQLGADVGAVAQGQLADPQPNQLVAAVGAQAGVQVVAGIQPVGQLAGHPCCRLGPVQMRVGGDPGQAPGITETSQLHKAVRVVSTIDYYLE